MAGRLPGKRSVGSLSYSVVCNEGKKPLKIAAAVETILRKSLPAAIIVGAHYVDAVSVDAIRRTRCTVE
jgi:hypothetical protein